MVDVDVDGIVQRKVIGRGNPGVWIGPRWEARQADVVVGIGRHHSVVRAVEGHVRVVDSSKLDGHKLDRVVWSLERWLSLQASAAVKLDGRDVAVGSLCVLRSERPRALCRRSA